MTPEERARARESVVIAAAPPESAVFQGVRVSWGGVWSGLLVGIGVLTLLAAFGIAVGVTTVEFRAGEAPDVRSFGLAAGIWAFVSLLVSLFVGGMVSTRMGMVFDRATGTVQGMLVWVLAMAGLLYLGAMGTGFGANALLGTTGTSGVAAPAGLAVAIAAGDVDQILVRLNDPRTAETVARVSGTTVDDARARLAAVGQRVAAYRNDPTRAAAEARRGVQELFAPPGRAAGAADRVRPYAWSTSWSTFAAMVITLLAAVFGALAGSGRAAARAIE